ncbi:histidinol dehydrogenase [Aquisalibacillus elongatus]|uniref:Histidinol dehydrogenase n=1 Tax=Aquisalibacillus elongatus TaxID=485577 RepID=A0A3N5CHL9_9BACI|nr:histidinol dehydrogenase [Aquisalibacillus elongatus]RPF57061.1 histidinol dehydrogenase [Aquisalibacillus elongatus]
MQITGVERADIPSIKTSKKDRENQDLRVIDERVKTIVETIKQEGESAVFQYIKELDQAELDSLFVSEEEIGRAFQSVSDEMVNILEEAKDNIESYHRLQKEQSWYEHQKQGIWLGQQVTPIERVGVYVPGGKAAYPSTVLMNILPAKVAGVKDIVVTTPAGQDGSVNPMTIVAARIAGATQILKVGGAHGIATLAYGTENLKPVDKITGPGNAYVARAKKYVFGDVGIDMIAGPSEVCILADDTANPEYVAADLLAQAEHDELASAILVTTSHEIAIQTQLEVDRQLEERKRKQILQQSIQHQSAIYVVSDLDVGFELINELAPEHLELMVENPFERLGSVQNAGAIFLGDYSPEPLGDYWAGPNHTLPTNGTAKFSSPLGVYDFMKKASVIYYDREALSQVEQNIQRFAEEEGLDGHAASIRKRFE